MMGVVVDFVFENPWVLGLVVSIGISSIPQIRRMARRSFNLLMLRFQADEVGINATYVKNYEQLPDGGFSNSLFETIKNEISHDQIQKTALDQRFLRIRSVKLGMKLSVSLDDEDAEIGDDDHGHASCNVILEMDADIRGTSNISHLDNFIAIAEKVHEIIRTSLFSEVILNSSYVICRVNNIVNDMDRQSTRSQTVDGDTITYKNNSTYIKSYNPHNLIKILKKHVYA